MSRRRIFFCRVFVAACNDPEQVRKWNIWRAILQVLSKVGHGWKLRLEDDGVLSSAEILSNCICVCVAAAFLIFWVLDWFPPIYCAVDNSIETRNKGIGQHSFAFLFYICVQYWGGPSPDLGCSLANRQADRQKKWERIGSICRMSPLRLINRYICIDTSCLSFFLLCFFLLFFCFLSNIQSKKSLINQFWKKYLTVIFVNKFN